MVGISNFQITSKLAVSGNKGPLQCLGVLLASNGLFGEYVLVFEEVVHGVGREVV